MRTYQLLNRKNKQEFKKLEQILKGRDEKGREVSINKNCAEMDKQIPLLMGVSNSILDNVIFCHQEESLWPFSDQANLKKIFDEIFDTSKYTKALVELRNIKKVYSKYAKEYKQHLEVLNAHFEQFKKLREKKKKNQHTLEENKIKCEAHMTKIKEIKKDLAEIETMEQKLNKLDHEISSQKMILTSKLKDYKEILKTLGVEDITDPSLNDTDEFQRQQDELLTKKESEKQKAVSDLRATREKLNKTITEKGNYQGMLKSKQERFNYSNNELMKSLEKIFNEMQESFSDPYRIKSLISSKNGQGAFVLVKTVVEEFKVQRDKILAQYGQKNSEFNTDIDDEEKQAKILETQLDMQRQSLTNLESRLKIMKDDEINSKENTQELDKIQKDLTDIYQKLNNFGVKMQTEQDNDTSYSTPKKIRNANNDLKDLSAKKNSIRDKIEDLEVEIASKQDILKTLDKLDEAKIRKEECTKKLADTTEQIKTQLKDISKLKFKKNKSNLLITTNEIIANVKENINKLADEKEQLTKKMLNSENNTKVLEKHLGDLKLRKKTLQAKISEMAGEELDIQVEANSQIVDQFSDEFVNEKYNEFVQQK